MRWLSEEQINTIKQSILIGNNSFIVRLNVAGNKNIPKSEYNSNIYYVNEDYEIFWQIKAEQANFERDFFVSIKLENEELIARRFSGLKYRVSLENGAAERVG